MTIALITNIVFATVIVTVIVGMLAWSVRVSAPRRRAGAARPETAPARATQPARARRGAYGSLARES